MANVLRDFFILEFAIYNFGNVSKQFAQIRRSAESINDTFALIDESIAKCIAAQKELVLLETLYTKLIRQNVEPQRLDALRKRIEKLKSDIKFLDAVLKELPVAARYADRAFANVATVMMASLGGMALTFKSLLDNFFRLDREAMKLVNTIGMGQSEAFAFAKSLENINLSAEQLSTALTAFYKNVFTSVEKQKLMVRLGFDPAMLLQGFDRLTLQSLNPLAVATYLVDTLKKADVAPGFRRAVMVQLLGKDLVDIITTMKNYRWKDIFEKYLNVFSPEMIAKTRELITQLQIVVAQFWRVLLPFLSGLIDTVRSIADVSDKILGNAIAQKILEIITLLGGAVTLIGGIVKWFGYLRTILGTIAGFVVMLRSGFNIASLITTIIAGVATGGVGAVLMGLLRTAFMTLVGYVLTRMGLSGLFGNEQKEAVKEIRDNTAETARNTYMSSVYLQKISGDIRNLIKSTAVGGSIAPLPQMVNMQMRLAYSAFQNVSVI